MSTKYAQSSEFGSGSKLCINGILSAGRVGNRDTGPRGGLLVGSTEENAKRIIFMHPQWGHVRRFIYIDVGCVLRKKLLRAIELIGTRVRPLVQAELGNSKVMDPVGRGRAASAALGRSGDSKGEAP